MDSIYTLCSNAARRLLKEPNPYTESDVVLSAASLAVEVNGIEWSEGDFAEADRHAPQVLAALFRSGHLVRFGVVSPDVSGPPTLGGQPVVYGAPHTGENDYVRREGLLVYGSADAWEGGSLSTPNGEFGSILYGARRDPLMKNGRRKSSNRDDFTPWSEQRPEEPAASRAEQTLKREVVRLKSMLEQANAKIDRMEAEHERLRSAAVANGRTREHIKS